MAEQITCLQLALDDHSKRRIFELTTGKIPPHLGKFRTSVSATSPLGANR